MAVKTITGLPAAAALAGGELMEVSQLSATVAIAAATISAQASDNSYNDSGSGFVAAGFAVNDRVRVVGFTGNVANNILVGVITALTAAKMTIGGSDGDVIVDDAAGESVTIAKWTSKRTTAAEAAALATSPAGKQTIWMPASAMIIATTNGPASAQVEMATNKQNVGVLDFDAAADEFAHFNVAFPKSWNLGTLSYRVFWTTAATGTTGVAWALEAVAVADNGAIDAAWGTAVVVTDDAQAGANEQLITAESAALTVGGSPSDDKLCYFRLSRDVSDANDDMAEDARLIGIQLFYTTDAVNDA